MTDDVWGLIEQKAQQYGEDPNTAKAIAQIESGGKNIPNSAGGSAAGVFQFMPQTAAQYGVTNPYDVDQNVDAGVRLLRDNRAALKSSLGRDPTPGELYLAHQQGAGGATKLLTNPDLSAASAVGARAVLANGGSLDMSAGQFASKWTTKVDGGAGYTPRTVAYTDLMAPPPVDPFKGTEDDRMKYREGLMGELDAFRDAYSVNTIVGNAYRNAQMPDALKPDPNFAPTAEQIKGYATNAQGQTLPPEYMRRFHDALSAGQAKWIADRAWEDVAKHQKLSSLGWAHNLGLNTAATLLDPASWAVAGATAGAINPALAGIARAGRLGALTAGALEGGASNVAITAALQHQGAPTTDADYLSALAMGMVLGGGFGALRGTPQARAVGEAGSDLSNFVKRPSSEAHDVEHSAPSAPAAVLEQQRVAPDVPGVLRDAQSFNSRSPFADLAHNAYFSAANDLDIPARPGGYDLGAAAVQYPVHPLDLNTGEIGSVREKGQFTSNISTANANFSNVLLPASGTQLASSPFAPTRILAAHLAGNPIGYKNAKNPIDAAMSALLMRGAANGTLDRFLKPAYHEWATDRGYGAVARKTKKPEFMREVYDYVTAKGTPEAHPAVARYANQAVKPLLKQWTERINESGLAEHLPYDTNYLPRIYDPGKVGDAYNTHGTGNLTHLVKASMADMEWTKALTPEQLDRVAKGYAEGISKKALDLQEDWNHSWSADNLDHLRSVLVSDSGMSAEEAKGITDAVARLTEKDRGANGRLKNRVDLDINAQHPATGDLRLSDMLVKDVSYLMERYNDQMAGRVALARTKIVDPDTGNVIVNGIKNDADFETMIREWKRTTEEQYLSKVSDPGEKKNLLNWRKRDEANMRFQYNRILSRGTEADNQLFGKNTQSGQVMRLMRKFSFDRMMGATGWSHMSIFGATLSGIGFRAAMEHIPAFRRITSMTGEEIRAHGLDRELEAIFGNHTDPLRGLQMHDWEHDWGATPLHQRNGVLGTADHILSQTNKITAVASGLSHIIDLNTRWAQKGMAQKIANMAFKAKTLADGSFDLSHVNMRRMMQLGLDEGDMQKVLGQVKQHATTENGIFFDHKLTKLNLDKWDQESAHLLQGAIRRAVDRMVQHNDIASLHRWSSSPLWQLMMQFRNFPMVGQTKQLMFNIAMRDPEAFNYFLTTSAMGALIYIARQKVNSIGREDREAYLEKTLAPHNIAHAALYHSGWAGMMPSIIDTGMRLSGGEPMFDFRTTGNSSALWGAPAVTNVDDFVKAAQAARRPEDEVRDRSQGEYRALARMFPWSNTLPGTVLTNLLVRNAPEHTPPKPR